MGEVLEAIADPVNLRLAWAKVRVNQRAGGVDRQTIAAFGADVEHRPGRSASDAVGWVRKAIRSGDRWVAEFDIVGFFDNLRHARLLREVAKVVDDVEVIGLIRRWLTAGVLTEAGLVARHTGTPQGGVISELLANIYLHRLDVSAHGRVPADPRRRRLRDPG